MKKFLLPFLAFVGACSGERPSTPTEVIPVTPKPKPTVVISAPSTPLPFNSMVQIGWSSTDANSCSAPWISTSSPSGSTSIRVTKPSWFSLSCTGPGGSIADSVRIEVLPRSARILIYIPSQDGDGYSLDTTFSTFSIQNGPKIDSLSIKGAGSLPISTVSPDTVSFTLSGNTQFPKVIARVPKTSFDSWGDTISIIRIPRTWKVEGGLYRGKLVTTNLILPFTKADYSSFYPRLYMENKQGYVYRELGWNNSAFPAKIWIDSAQSVSMFGNIPTADDSVRLAAGLKILDNFVGKTLFRFGYLTQNDAGVHAYIGNGSLPTGGAKQNDLGEIYDGSYFTTKNSRFGTEHEIRHELFHVLGFGHTCAWPGLMQTGCVWDGPGVTYPEPEKDVAFFELWQSVNDIRRKTGARIHWGENLAGTQQETGLPVDRVVYPL